MAIAGATRGVAADAPAAVGLTPLMAQAVVLAAVGVAAAYALATNRTAEAHAVAQAGPDLTRLLRAMAAIKVLFAAGALAAMVWRLQTPATVPRLAAYAVAAAGMAAGPVLIWGMVHVALGALLLHAGLIGCVVLLWFDPAVSRRLAALVAARRR